MSNKSSKRFIELYTQPKSSFQVFLSSGIFEKIVLNSDQVNRNADYRYLPLLQLLQIQPSTLISSSVVNYLLRNPFFFSLPSEHISSGSHRFSLPNFPPPTHCFIPDPQLQPGSPLQEMKTISNIAWATKNHLQK